MRKLSYVIPVALASFLSAGSAFAGFVINNDGTSMWDAKAPARGCVHVAAPDSAPTIANDGTVIGDGIASKRTCVNGPDYKNMTSEQFNELVRTLSS